MPNKPFLRYLPIAVQDLESIFDWIAAHSPSRAATFIEKVEKRVATLETHPLLGRIPRDPRLKSMDYRVLILDDYLVFYKVRSEVIEIHRIVHGSRNLDDLI